MFELLLFNVTQPIQSTLAHTTSIQFYEKRLLNKNQNRTIGYRLCADMDSSPISYWCVNEDVTEIFVSYTAYPIL